MPIYANNNIAGNSYLTRQTDASAYSVNATASDKLVVFEVDPAALDTANSFDFVALHIAASGKSTNYASVVAIVENRNGGYDEVDLLS